MNTERYTVEILTPCFCAGADQSTAEIRVPSIRGQLRWWFRVLGGTWEEEKAVFGGVHPGARTTNGGAKASRIRIRVQEPCNSHESVNLKTLNWISSPGRSYLLWPLRPTKNSEQMRGMVRPGNQFTLHVGYSTAGESPDQQIQMANRALKAWLLLGSLGTRSRRGMGGVWPVKGPFHTPDDVISFQAALRDIHLPCGVRVITLSQGMESWEDALEEAGLWLKQWRAGSTKSVTHPNRFGQNDHDAALGKASKVYRPALGLPLEQRYSSGGTYSSSINAGDRWASPVHIKIISLGKDYFPIAIFLPQMAPQEGTQVDIRNKRGPEKWTLPVDHGLLREMMIPPNDGSILLDALP